MPEDEPLEHSLLTKTIENAQKKVEGNNFAIRKHVLKYDDVMNKQREVIYSQRRMVLQGENLRNQIIEMAKELVESNVNFYTAQSKNIEDWDVEALEKYLEKQFGLNKDVFSSVEKNSLTKEKLIDLINEKIEEKYALKEKEFGADNFREIERIILLQVVDRKWMDHIDAMDQLRQGIGLRAYGQQDPVIAYQKEGFDMFEEMSQDIWEDTVGFLFHVESPEKIQRKRVAEPLATNMDNNSNSSANKTVINKEKKVGRNEPCPCGSGKKYKKCCGADK